MPATRPSRRLFVCLVGAALTLSGCPSWWTDMTGPNAEDLERSMSAVRKQMLFGRYANAKALVFPAKKAAFTRYFFTVEDRIKITGFDPQSMDIVEVPPEDALNPDDPREARVLIRMQYTMRPNMELQKALIEMTWIPIAGGWMFDFPEEGWEL